VSIVVCAENGSRDNSVKADQDQMTSKQSTVPPLTSHSECKLKRNKLPPTTIGSRAADKGNNAGQWMIQTTHLLLLEGGCHCLCTRLALAFIPSLFVCLRYCYCTYYMLAMDEFSSSVFFGNQYIPIHSSGSRGDCCCSTWDASTTM